MGMGCGVAGLAGVGVVGVGWFVVLAGGAERIGVLEWERGGIGNAVSV